MNVKTLFVRRVTLITITLAALCVTTGLGLTGAMGQQEPGQPTAAQAQPVQAQGYVFLAISLSIGLSCIGAGYAVGHVGAAALGAASEKPELLTRSLLFVALAEGIAIYGLLVSILLLRRL
jgi:V/A-type H+-transporting ATPase subunit K